MAGFLKKAVLGATLAASAVATVAPADAQYYRGYRGGYRHHDGIGTGGAAVLGGILGLGLGAAIASNNNRDRYYDRGYAYDRGYYYQAPPRVVYRERYYERPPVVVYRDGYYDRRGYDRGYRGYDRGYYGY